MSFSNNFPTTSPSLELDFANVNALDPRITFTRSSIATVTNSLGLLQTVQANVPRFDYDPVTLAPRGLLIEEQRTNLLTYSEQFDNAVWNKGTGGSIAANTVVAPDGSTSADEYTWATSTSAFAYLMQQVSGNPTNPHTYSLWLKRPSGSGSRNVRLAISDITIGSASSSDFTVTETWQRFSFTRTSVNSTGLVGGGLGAGLTNSIVAGEILHVWGAQLEAGSFATSYVPSTQTFTGRTSTGTFIGSNGLIQTAGVGVARMQYNPTNLNAQPFLLLEAAATNLVTFSDGTLAQLANSSNVSNAASPISASFTNSIEFGDNSALRFAYKTFTTVISTVYTLSVFVRMNDDSVPVVGTTATAGDFSLVLESGLQASPVAVTSFGGGVYRVSTFVAATLGVSSNFGVIKYTTQSTKGFRVTGYQLEAGSFPTSYIPTVATTGNRSADTSTSAATTRNADAASMTGTAFSSWFNAAEGTLYGDFMPYLVTGNGGVVSANDGTGNNRIDLRRDGFSIVTTAGVNQANMSVAGMTANVSNRLAVGYAVNNFALVRNGGAVTTDTSGTVPSGINLLQIAGLDNNPSFSLNGHIRKVAYYPVRLSNTNLQALTL